MVTLSSWESHYGISRRRRSVSSASHWEQRSSPLEAPLDRQDTRSRGRDGGESCPVTWSRTACDPDPVHRVTVSASSHPGHGFKHGPLAKAPELRSSMAVWSRHTVWVCNWLQIVKLRRLDWLSRVEGHHAPEATPRVAPEIHLGNRWDGFCKRKDSQNRHQRPRPRLSLRVGRSPLATDVSQALHFDHK